MVESRVALCAGVALCAVSVHARADLDVTLANNTQVEAEIAPADDSETFRLWLPEGAKLTALAKARPTKGETAVALAFDVLDDSDARLVSGLPKGKSVRLKGFVVPRSGEYRVVVAGDGANRGRYQLKIKWRPATRVKREVALTGAGAEARFAAEPGTIAAFKVKAAKQSAALPRLARVASTDDSFVFDAFAPAKNGAKSHAQKSLSLGDPLDYLLTLGNDGADGSAKFDIKLKAPKVQKSKVDLTDAALSGGGRPGASGGIPAAAFGGVIAAGGGALVASGPLAGVLQGAGITVPPGALANPSAIIFGVAANELPPPNALLEAVGPTTFFGPPGLMFSPPATVTIPFDPTGLAANLDDVEVFARDEDGTVTKVPGPYTFDLEAGTCSFPVSHFTSFRVFAPPLVLAALNEFEIAPADGGSADEFGRAVALDGDTIVIGAQNNDEAATGAGAAYVFVRSGSSWFLEQKLVASDPRTSMRFGTSVAIDGDTIVVGARLGQEGPFLPGTAYVFTRSGTTWSLQQRLIGSQTPNNGQFGSAVAIHGDTCLIGAAGELVGQGVTQAGAVYSFERSGTTWSEVQRFAMATPVANQNFGAALAMTADRAVVGGPGTLVPGAAFVFDRAQGQWSETAELDPGARMLEEDFGESVAISGGVIAVGDPLHDASAQPQERNAGKVFVFELGDGSWPFEAGLEAPLIEANASFGASVALDGDMLSVGASRDPLPGIGTVGAVHMFSRAGGVWPFELEVTRTGPKLLDAFGASVVLSGSDLVVGTPGFTPGVGTVLTYDLARVAQ